MENNESGLFKKAPGVKLSEEEKKKIKDEKLKKDLQKDEETLDNFLEKNPNLNKKKDPNEGYF